MRRRAAKKKEPLIVGSYNLHGHQDNDRERFQQIAGELAYYDIDICGLQEVINGNGIEDTSFQVARNLYKLTGNYYWSYWAYCHPFYDLYPEGIAILSRHPIQKPTIIDLNVSLRKKLQPLLPRVALSAEFELKGRRLIFTTTHLDHHPDEAVRTAQISTLVRMLGIKFPGKGYNASIITGDFNASENARSLRTLKRRGFRDSYRKIHNTGGNTFPACAPNCRIDYIMVKGRIRVIDSFISLKGENWSDHFGVISILG